MALTFFSDTMSTDLTVSDTIETSNKFDVMMILQMLIASVGIVANFTVVFAFLNHKVLRRKIPNMFIINQVSSFCTVVLCFSVEKDIHYYSVFTVRQ